MKRDRDLDILKGLAVVAMSFVHVNIFFLDQQATFLDQITKWGAISCFSTFLLIVGILQGKFLSNERKPKWSKTFRRVLFLYISYIIIAVLSLYISKDSIYVKDFFEILIFRKLPLLSEYLVHFILITLLFQFFHRELSKITNSVLLTISLSVFAYLVGYSLYELNFLDDFWIKSLFVGGGDSNYFPLIQYLPIYLLGLFLGRQKGKKSYILFTLGIVLIFFGLRAFGLSVWNRFPPSVYFLVQSMVLPLGILALLKGFDIDVKFAPLEVYAKDSLLSLVILTVITLLLANFFSPLFPVVGVWVTNLAVVSLTGVLLALYFWVRKMV